MSGDVVDLLVDTHFIVAAVERGVVILQCTHLGSVVWQWCVFANRLSTF